MSEPSFLSVNWPALTGVALAVVALAVWVAYRIIDRINRRRAQVMRRAGVHRAGVHRAGSRAKV